MRHEVLSTDLAAPISLETAIAIVIAAGYQVTKPKPKKEKQADFRIDPIEGYTTAMRKWDRASVTFTFADGETVHAYALRENAKKEWFLGSAARAACDKYRYRKQKATRTYVHGGPLSRAFSDRPSSTEKYWACIGPTRESVISLSTAIDTIAVPDIVNIEGVEISAALVNEKMASYRAPSATSRY